MVKPIPDGFTAITPYLVIDDPQAEIVFLEEVLDAQTIMTMPGPGGAIMHAEVSISGARVMMGKASGPHKALPALLYVYLPDVDATFAKAAKHPGITIEHPPMDQFYGDRSATVRTVNGIRWSIATHKEDLTPAQISERMQSAMSQRKEAAG